MKDDEFILPRRGRTGRERKAVWHKFAVLQARKWCGAKKRVHGRERCELQMSVCQKGANSTQRERTFFPS